MADEVKNNPKVKEILYSQALSREQVDSILDNFSDLRILYHSTSSGLKFQGDSVVDDPLLVLKGRGDTTEVSSADLKNLITQYPVHGNYIYELFSKGILTFENFENSNIVFEENFMNQEDIEVSSHNIVGQFNNEGVFINTGDGKGAI